MLLSCPLIHCGPHSWCKACLSQLLGLCTETSLLGGLSTPYPGFSIPRSLNFQHLSYSELCWPAPHLCDHMLSVPKQYLKNPGIGNSNIHVLSKCADFSQLNIKENHLESFIDHIEFSNVSLFSR